jgi:hypothetical protein
LINTFFIAFLFQGNASRQLLPSGLKTNKDLNT